LLTRRNALVLTGLALGGKLFAAVDRFWNTKDPAQWSPDEIHRMLTDSPWAKRVSIGQTGGGATSHQPWGENPPVYGNPSGGVVQPPIDMSRGRGRERATPSGVEAVVRWASATPIIAATKTPVPDDFRDHYCIAVVGMLLPAGFKDKIEDLKQFTSLRPKGKDLAQPGVVQWDQHSSTLLFGFSKDILVLGKSDREVAFETKAEQFEVQASFPLKEMYYRGELAL
jgi:hypothetical protein